MDNQKEVTGIIHSIETCGTVDGPGIRFVIFTQGCPLRCLYCHNPGCQYIEKGKIMSVDALMEEILQYQSYFKFSGGGVTISGGEPLMQPEFVQEIFRKCRCLGIPTALDTSGYANLSLVKPVLEYTDLVLLDIKSFDPTVYQKVTYVSLKSTLKFARYLNKIHKPVWIRFVLVPDLTDSLEHITQLAQFIANFDNLERVEVLPFHKMGEDKWKQLGYDYQLQATPPPSPELLEKVINIFKSYGLAVCKRSGG
jgi:pyruvate formate lyase activating enzyme